MRVLTEEPDLFYDFHLKTLSCDENDLRVTWLRAFADYAKGMAGDVAECGVNLGDFAYYINKYFKGKKLWLFDTFDGFSPDDLQTEINLGNEAFDTDIWCAEDKFRYTFDSADMVKNKMPFPEQCEIKKGYFPDTAQGISKKFCFVNLDMDLYAPMFEALKFFYPLMIENGVILLHDYFSATLPGVKKAVADFEEHIGKKAAKLPIGDGCSLAIVAERYDKKY